MIRRLNVPVPDEDLLERLGTAKRPLRMSATRPKFQLLRETVFDSRDHLLRERRMVLRLSAEARGRQRLELSIVTGVSLQGIVEESTLDTPVVDGGLYATLAGASELATRVREVLDPAALRPIIALDIDREARELKRYPIGRPLVRAVFDRIIGHAPGATRAFQELTLVELGVPDGLLDDLADRLRNDLGLESDGMDTAERVRLTLLAGRDGPRVEVPHDVRVASLLLSGGRVGLQQGPDGLSIPTTRGTGEELSREHVRDLVGTSRYEADPELIGFTPTRRGDSDLEVWLHEVTAVHEHAPELVWIPLAELLERLGGPQLRDAGLVATALLLVRSEIGLRLLREGASARGAPTRLPVGSEADGKPGPPEHFLDLELSILDFNKRVLELAEDPSVPLLERFRFLAIFSRNIDEFFVVRVGRLKDEAGRGAPASADELSATELLDLFAVRVRALVARQYACLTHLLLPALAERGVRLRRWEELSAEDRASLARVFESDVYPLLTPLTMSASPGRAFPRLVSLGLSLAVVMRRPEESRPQYGYVPVPESLPRFLRVPGAADIVAIEDVIAGHAHTLFPTAEVVDVHTFRVSRMADVEIDEDSSGSLLAAVADEVHERPFKPVVRIEVQNTMRREVRAHLLRELRAERGSDSAVLTRADVYELDGPIDLDGFEELTELELDGARYEPFEAARPLPEDVSIFDTLAARDVLVHHPYESFQNSVGRFLSEAADDPDVLAIKLTLYRTGRSSPVMDALLRALEARKEVSVFVELTARFDEESNIEWTHRLTAAGAHVVFGVLGYKTHAKTALVVRRESQGVRRYVHIGTGNYNATTARFYTDFGLMSADPDLGADLHEFFNALTGSSGPPDRAFRRLLVAPNSLMPGLLRLIEREIEHARGGRSARIQAKMNGLADRRIVRALYAASQEGVRIDLMVRSICTLRPGVPGLSECIQVRSLLGRFLEHARIYYFENAGQGEYYIGSADWRARNLRKRVEVVAPVDDADGRRRLRAVLDSELADPRAWVLRPDGVYERLQGEGPTSQEWFMEAARASAPR